MDTEFITSILLENATQNVNLMQNIHFQISLSLAYLYFISSLNLDQGGVSIVEMLFCTSLVALVGSGDHPQMSPRRLQIKNTKSVFLLERNYDMRTYIPYFDT
ncbi:Autophagy-related protein 18 [Smittium culicis]|uniref:Autophagy-related protein 18 n=1 Tax=Smittium culicis TaxID=133412 RepID=A0A1R1YEY8_9FUNG|nr:Autophagy-related protein 18 [Smittium culicis]